MSKSLFAEDLHIKGDVISQGDIETHGVVEGGLSARTLRTGKGAKIVGSARAGKTFIGRIARGFDFLGYHFSPAGLTLARPTVTNFQEKVS